MRAWMFQLARSVVIVAMMTISGSTSPATLLDPALIPVESPAARLGPEVRLRKLHLVRPDLIPYPISYEIYC